MSLIIPQIGTITCSSPQKQEISKPSTVKLCRMARVQMRRKYLSVYPHFRQDLRIGGGTTSRFKKDTWMLEDRLYVVGYHLLFNRSMYRNYITLQIFSFYF